MAERDPSSSPDPIILPSSPPSAHVRSYEHDPRAETRRSPAKLSNTDTPGGRVDSPGRTRRTADPHLDEPNESSLQGRQIPRNGGSPGRTPSTRSRTKLLPQLLQLEHDLLPRPLKRKRPSDDYASSHRAARAPSAARRNGVVSEHSRNSRAYSQASDGYSMVGEQTMANEDFTMISGDSLASIKANNSLILTRDRASRRADADADLNIDPNLDAYPSAITYPDLPHQTEVPPPVSVSTSHAEKLTDVSRGQSSQSVIKPSRSSPPPSTLHNNGPNNLDEDLDDDIWAEEASRQLEHEISGQSPYQHDFVPPIFSDEVQPPLRSKIPKTWRRASGVNLTYSDSPAQPPGEPRSTSGKVARSPRQNMLSPPQTGDAHGNRANSGHVEDDGLQDDLVEYEDEDEDSGDRIGGEDMLESSEITNPDAAATQLQTDEVLKTRPIVTTPRLPLHSPSADETGLFWRSERKILFSKGPQRPRRTQAGPAVPDLGNILKSDSHPATPSPSRARPDSHKQPSILAATRNSMSRLDRQSIHHTDIHAGKSAKRSSGQPQQSNNYSEVPTHVQSQQLDALPHVSHELNENGRSQAKTYGRTYFRKPALLQKSTRDIMDSSQDVSQSYEEHLNRFSPGKHRVNFDGIENEDPTIDRLKPTRQYPSLFQRSQPLVQQEESLTDMEEETALDKARGTSVELSQEAEPGLLTKFASAVWSAVVRPRGPIYLEPSADEPSFPPTLRARIRSRYGVLQDRHPWTMMHMRTLHRMVNSVTVRGSESIIPTSLRLPHFLESLVGNEQYSVLGDPYEFTHEYACAVWSFMQILVPLSLIRAMERGEVEWLGDDITMSYKGLMDGHKGSELCFKTVSTPEGVIEWPWLVGCVGCVLYAELDARERLANASTNA